MKTAKTKKSLKSQESHIATFVPGTRIEPLFNDVFIRVFGSQRSVNLTRGFVNAVLCQAGMEPIDTIERLEAEHTPVNGSVDCKTPRMDIRIVAEGRLFDLEAQNYPEDVDSRSMLYGAQLLCSNTYSGTSYKDLPQAVVITLLSDKPKFPDSDEFVHVCSMNWDVDGKPQPGSDRMLFILVDLSKIRSRYTMLTNDVLSDELIAWLYLLTSGYRSEEEVDEIMGTFPTIEEFAELYGYAIDDPKIQIAYRDYESAEREYQSRQDYYARVRREAYEEALVEGREKGLAEGLAEGRAQGIAEGRAEGLAEGRADARASIAEKLRAAGVDESIIRAAIQ